VKTDWKAKKLSVASSQLLVESEGNKKREESNEQSLELGSWNFELSAFDSSLITRHSLL
jgi:hypothetical protein